MVDKYQEIYISTDIESDGPLPGVNSMLSLASAAYSAERELLALYSANLDTLPDAKPDPVTMSEFWHKNPNAWEACRMNTRAPLIVMREYRKWVEELGGKPVFVGYPATYDFMFVYWYLVMFTGGSPFGFSALDVKSYAMAVLGKTFRKTVKKKMPKEWFNPNYKHTHVALDDAIEQGELFCSMLRDNLKARDILQLINKIQRKDKRNG